MHKIERGGLLVPFAPHTIRHINEETCLFASVDTQKPPQLEGKTYPLRIDRDKDHP